MAFVYEKISEEDKKRIDFSKIKAGLRPVSLCDWVINRELNAFFVWAYPEREPPYQVWYAFWWQGKVFEVAIVDEQSLKTSGGKSIVRRRITNILVPHGLSAPSAEVDVAVEKIREAVEVSARAEAERAGWADKIAEIQIEIERANKGTN